MTFKDKKLNKALAQIRGKGPISWQALKAIYGDSRLIEIKDDDGYCVVSKFSQSLHEYAKKSERIIIKRPYNVSDSPTIEVLEVSS
jgi:hypothetical protein